MVPGCSWVPGRAPLLVRDALERGDFRRRGFKKLAFTNNLAVQLLQSESELQVRV